MPEIFRILCIDDEPVLHTLIDATLGFTYEVALAGEGLVQLGLSEPQEARIAETLRTAVHQVIDDEGLGMDAHLPAITAELIMARQGNRAST